MDDFRWEAPRRGQTWGKAWGGELFSVDTASSKTGLFGSPQQKDVVAFSLSSCRSSRVFGQERTSVLTVQRNKLRLRVLKGSS